jgi:cholest-4-en-3-one 26-monooxygenase
VLPTSDQPISLVTQDEPRHGQMRRIVNRGFTPRRVKRLEPRIAEIVERSIDAIAPLGECDFVEALAAPLPLRIIAEMLGIPAEDHEQLFEWSNTMIAASAGMSDVHRVAAAGRVFAEFAAYLLPILPERQRAPREDLLSALLAAESSGTLASSEVLEDDDILMFCTLLLTAGNETTRNALSAGIAALSRFRPEWERLVARPELLDTAVDEIVRFTTPVTLFRRTATQPTELRGQKIWEGDRVLIFYPSANRDAAVFDAPHELRLDRDPNPHLAFGIGNHYCLGANLARLEIRHLIGALARRLPDLRVAPGAAPVYTPTPFVRAVESLPVVFTSVA